MIYLRDFSEFREAQMTTKFDPAAIRILEHGRTPINSETIALVTKLAGLPEGRELAEAVLELSEEYCGPERKLARAYLDQLDGKAGEL